MDGSMEVRIKVELFCWCILGVYDISLVREMRSLKRVSPLVMEFGESALLTQLATMLVTYFNIGSM